jgi:hypothetical protein
MSDQIHVISTAADLGLQYVCAVLSWFAGNSGQLVIHVCYLHDR